MCQNYYDPNAPQKEINIINHKANISHSSHLQIPMEPHAELTIQIEFTPSKKIPQWQDSRPKDGLVKRVKERLEDFLRGSRRYLDGTFKSLPNPFRYEPRGTHPRN